MDILASASGRQRDGRRLRRLLFPDLFAQVERRTEDDIRVSLDDAAARLREPGGLLSVTGLADIDDEEVRTRFERSVAQARDLFQLIAIDPPSVDAWETAGADLGRLAEAASQDASLVLVAAPHGLGVDAWKRLFERVAGEGGTALEAPGVQFATEVEEEFAVLDRVQDPATPRTREGDRVWTLRLIPADQAPQLVGFNYAHGDHPSLPEMLTLQLLQLRAGGPPLDERSFTWIAGTLSGSLTPGTLAARHVFDATEGVVRVSCREPANQGPHLGARPPIG